MNILHIVPRFPPAVGGMEKVAYDTTLRLSKIGHKVTVYTSRAGSKLGIEVKSENLIVYFLPSIEVAHTPILPGLLFKLLVNAGKYDVMHVHVAQAYVPEIVYLASIATGVPYIVHFHLDVKPSGAMGFLLGFYHRHILSRVLRHAAAVITLTQKDKTLMVSKYKVEIRRIHTIPNGIESSVAKPRVFKFKKVYSLLFVGRLSPQKNLNLLLDALKYVKTPVMLDIVGDGELRQTLVLKQKKLGLKNVKFHGEKQSRYLHNYYHHADLLLLPSLDESFSLVIMEASAAGLPALVADLPNLREVYGDAVKYITDYTAPGIASCIDALLNDEIERNVLSRKAFRMARGYTLSTQVNKIVSLYQKIIDYD